MVDTIRVLYVDDELGLLEIAKLYLEESGEFSVTTIDSVSAALDLLRKEKFDVIISDYQMPGKDGIQFLIEVRTRFGKIPFILFTGKGRQEVVIQAINSGADFYLQKGGDPDAQFAELSHKLRSATSRKMVDDSLLKNVEELHAAYEELAATEEELRANLDELTLQEQTLRESEEQKKAILNGITTNIAFVDKDLKILWVNKFAAESVNKSSVEMIGHTCHSLWADPARPCENCPTLRVFETKQSEHTVMHTPDGRVWDEKGEPVFDEKGNLIGVVEIAQDITERKRAEEKLKSSEIRYRRFFEAVRDGILILDAETGTILDVNPFLIKLLGFTHEQFLGKKLWEIGIFKDIAASKDNFKKLQEKKYIHYDDLPLETIDGRQIYSEFVSFVYDVDSKNVMQCNIRDITERKRAEAALLKNTEELLTHQVELEAQAEELRQSHLALEESRDKFIDLYEFAPIGYLTLNDKALITEANLTSASLLGTERSQLVNHGLGRFIDSKSHDAWDLYFANVRQHVEKQICNLTLIRGDGSLFPARLEGIRTIRIDGIITVRTAISDITDIWQIEALRTSEEKFRLLTTGSSDAIGILDTAGKIQYISNNVIDISGFQPDEYEGISVLKFVHPDDRKEIDALFEQIIRGTAKSLMKEFRISRKDGGWVWVVVLGTNYIDNPAVNGIVVNLRNITERKQTEDKIKTSETRYRRLFESAQDGILILNRETGEIINSNPFIEKLTGYTKEELIGKPIWDIGFIKDLVASKLAFAKLQANEYIRYEDLPLEMKDGQRIDVEFISNVYPIDPHISVIQCNIRDITDRKRAEEALNQANKKLNLLSGLTRHDLKNKVITIQGFLQFARKSKDIKEIQPFLDKIQDSAKAIEHQINFSKDYQDLGVKSPIWLNLSNMIILASNPAIQITDETGTIQIFADPLFEKVMYNLTDNTIRHGETATESHVSVITEKDDIRIIWEDNGVGVPVEEKEMIFQRGFGKNTGLGLFLIREILAITGMTIQETGEPGKGARFEITVPNGMWRKGKVEDKMI